MGKWKNAWYNPILVKEIRSRMRTRKTAWLLTAYVGVVGLGIFAYMYLYNRDQTFFNPGQNRTVFIMLAALQLLLIAFVAPGLTAGTISGERERQTLNILLTTHLSPLKIVLSKLASSMAFLSVLVFATIPVYVLVFLSGGIAPWQVFAVFGYYLMAMILFGSIGLFCSAWFKRTSVSTVVAYGVTLAIMGATVLLAGLFSDYLMRHYSIPGQPIGAHPEVFYVSGLNPLMNLVGMFQPDELLMNRPPVVITLPMAPWLYLLIVYMPFSTLLLALSVWLVMPVKKRLFR